MASRIENVAPTELDAMLDRARAEAWREFVLLGPGVWISDRREDWASAWKAADRAFRLTASTDALAGKLRSLPALASLSLYGHSIGDAGAEAIARSLTGLAALDLSDNNIDDVGAEAP